MAEAHTIARYAKQNFDRGGRVFLFHLLVNEEGTWAIGPARNPGETTFSVYRNDLPGVLSSRAVERAVEASIRSGGIPYKARR